MERHVFSRVNWVKEWGGTTLVSILLNKNLWSGQPCERGKCKPCTQEGERKEPCTAKNIVYESECTKCTPLGSRKDADKEGLEEKRDVASLYVGATARSLNERAGQVTAQSKQFQSNKQILEQLQWQLDQCLNFTSANKGLEEEKTMSMTRSFNF